RTPVVAFGILRADGSAVYGVSTEMDGVQPFAESANVYVAEIEFANLALLPGAYAIRAHPLDSEGVRLFDTLERGIVVRGHSREFGLIRLDHTWRRAPEAPAQEPRPLRAAGP
ncbi:MAG: Wzt carbohydrate-binding domain-containing protein, partial [Rudaea sp.]